MNTEKKIGAVLLAGCGFIACCIFPILFLIAGIGVGAYLVFKKK